MKTTVLSTALFILLFTVSTLAQRSVITLSFTGDSIGKHVHVDSVKIQNLDRNWELTLHWPDTVFIKNNVGISEPSPATNGLRVFQNSPNPVGERTSVKIYMPETGVVQLQVTDAEGRVAVSLEKELNKGYHSFSFTPGSSRIYLFTAIYQSRQSSIKMVADAKPGVSACSLSYLGAGDSGSGLKSSAFQSDLPFAFKDNLKMTGYFKGLTSIILDAPEESKTETFFFSGFTCGSSLIVTHGAGAVAPVPKTVTYGTVTNIPGEPAKCWITSNLGASNQATAADDATEASAGWYWQFNRKQGYQHDGTTRTPGTIWATSQDDPLYWLSANDPCTLELGAGWRIPTFTEWFNVDASGVWTDPAGPWNSGLKIHAAGCLNITNGQLVSRGSYGFYWSSSSEWHIDDYHGRYLVIYTGHSYVDYNYKGYGFSLRCLRD
ncbi:MAG: hypothetical protein NT040_13920 [Bacteroidetes bacterium]|nr:hypothetical protein [Bacteroidota bacterium]